MEYVYGISDSCKMQYALVNIQTAHCTKIFSAFTKLAITRSYCVPVYMLHNVTIVRQFHNIYSVTRCYTVLQ